MAHRLPQPAEIIFEDEIPYNVGFEDSYFSRHGGIEETNEVFIKACDIQNQWQNKNNFIIAETGFGTGLNLLCVWDLWQKSKQSGILHFISFEKHPIKLEDAIKIHHNFEQFAQLSKKLLEKWPAIIYGTQRIWLEQNLCFTIIIDDAANSMPLQNFKADCWFLDGFAPSRNSDFWSKEIFEQINRLSKPNVKIGTYSAAAAIRENLGNYGFEFERVKGFANKKHRLNAWKNGIYNEVPNPKTAAIIGGGIAGCAIAFALNKRGINCTIFDDDEAGNTKASNNKIGMMMPRLDRLDNSLSRFFTNAFLYASEFYDELSNNYSYECAIEERAKTKRDIEKYAMFAKDLPIPPEYIEVKEDSILHKKAKIIYPEKIIARCSILSNGGTST